MSRREDLEHFVSLVGASTARVVDLGNGWPGLVEVESSSGTLRAAIHIGCMGLSHRGRDAVERRFQNPGQNRPVTSPSGSVPLLLGVWEDEAWPVIVGMEITDHRLTANTRQSYFAPLQLLRQAEAVGWADHVSTTGEHIVVFHPRLLPVFVEMRKARVAIPALQVASIVGASGLGNGEEEIPAHERARRASSILVRSASFSQRVIASYDRLCAMCGLNFGLLEGAHILPVRAPGSPDEIWNGLALCANHHAAFDKHRVWVNPSTRNLQLHPDFRNEVPMNKACRQFVATTFDTLRAPSSLADSPHSEMFERRYEFFNGQYAWAD